MAPKKRKNESFDAPSLAALLNEASQQAHSQLERVLNPEGLPVDQWRVLECLSDGQGRSMSALADEIDIKLSWLSKVIDRMVTSALVQRAQDPLDQRRVLVYVSDIGVEKFRLLRARVRKSRQNFEDKLGNERGEALRRLLEELLDSRSA